MKSWKIYFYVSACVLFLAVSVQADSVVYSLADVGSQQLCDGYPASYLAKLSMPDYWQRDTAYGGLPGGGANHCVPTAVSNSIMWYDDNGYDNLVTNTSDRKKDQFDLINVLDDPQYCNTDPVLGSSPSDYIPGIQKWFDDSAYGNSPGFEVKYSGLHYTGPEWTGSYAATESWIKDELSRCEDVILRIGWYYIEGNYLYREGGHGVTFAGYDDTDTQYNPGDLIIHDPDDGTAAVTHDNYSLSTITLNLGAPGIFDFMIVDGYGGSYIAMVDGAIAVSPIPEPITVCLFGLGGLILLRRRKR